MPESLIDLLLEKRGITDPLEKEAFLHPSYEAHLHDPLLMHDMERAVVRLFEAIEAKEKVVIYADYDCDGIPGGAILHDLLKKIGYANFSVYIPDRHEEGYGLNQEAVDMFLADGVSLVITVDLGTTDVATIASAEAGGMNIIVTDHHEPPPELPHAYALVNPKLGTYPERMLCGAGVAFKFAQAFLAKYRDYYKVPVGWEKWLLDMAALGTLSDMVPLRGENRVIAYWGLRVLRKSPRPGFSLLLRKANVDQAHLTEDDIAFMVTPRINAASRMDSPMRAFELLAATDMKEASALVEHLERINTERKTLVATLVKQAKARLAKRGEIGDIIVIGDPSWRIGILGLIAGKLMDEYDRPVFVWGREGSNDENILKGSCRSNGSVNIVELMRSRAALFDGLGGHELAGGFSIKNEHIHTLEQELRASFNDLKREKAETNDEVDLRVSLADIKESDFDAIDLLAPYGVENKKPLLHLPRVSVKSAKKFGKEKNHLEFVLEDGTKTRKAILFFGAESLEGELPPSGSEVVVMGHLERSYFGGREERRLRIVSWHMIP